MGKNDYGRNIAISYLDLDGDEVLNIRNDQLKSFYTDKKGNELDTFASQFNCQGLELDYTVMIWGSKMLRRGSEWVMSNNSIGAIDSYCKKIEELGKKYPHLAPFLRVDKKQIRDTFIKNCYRVLLTRSRISTYIYVEDPETYTYLKNIIEVS